MKTWTDEETGIRFANPDCCDEWLFDIWAIGFDYDGENTIEGLKKCIDNLVEMSIKARECLWDDKLFGVHGHPERYRVPSKQEWIEQYGTKKQIAGFEHRQNNMTR